MTRVLHQSDPDFSRSFEALLVREHDDLSAVDATVAEIIATVRREGDAALVRFTREFDRHEIAVAGLRFSEADIASLAARCDAEIREALTFAAERIRRYHQALLPVDLDYVDEVGVRLGARWRPVDSAGIYVPGGTAAYPSSVLMNAIPACVAGVTRIAMTVPTPDGLANPAVFAAAQIAGVSEIYGIGGAQAIAALAFGTETIRPVDKIVGPGNIYVAAAKKSVFGRVGIDTIAGPSEITIVADATNNPDWMAADLLSQAEHDVNAQAILITDDVSFAAAVGDAVERLLKGMTRADIARTSWERNGAIVISRDRAGAVELVNRIAPEHLELAVENPSDMAAEIRHAGAIFLGRWTPETLGDYVGGPNHVLPTSGAARFSSGLGVHDFLKRTSILECGPNSFAALAMPAIVLAHSEGLEGHARAAALRLRHHNDGPGRDVG
ncbi:MAG: histidinol dehydrogenase [Rhodospirillaceae bacterium]|nr:histidinol dehydrogenase [Rhodospirillaceae bacterium]